LLTDASRRAQVFFVGSMDPSLQRAVIDQSGATLIGADSMTVFIDDRRDEVRSVVERVDVLFLNAAELEALTGSSGWREAAAGLCGAGRLRAVVVKRGPAGAACVTAAGIVELPAAPVAEVVDPTGAGDALAGGFLGYLAHLERADAAIFAAALAEGVQCAAGAIAAFGTRGLLGTGAV
jgi:sugar/nucleoside kinase (ribokinase family)